MAWLERVDRDATRTDRDLARRCREYFVAPAGRKAHSLGGRWAICAMVVLGALAAGACSAPPIEEEPVSVDDATQTSAGENEDEDQNPRPAETMSADAGGLDAAQTPDASDGAVAPPPVTAAALMAKLSGCTKASSAPYATDVGKTANIDVCRLTGAVFWTSDMDIDCDGKPSSVCNKSTDPSYQAQTATTDSKGQHLDAATLPFVVVPGLSSRWSYKASGVAMGSVVAVIYNGKVEYGIVGDVGPVSILGEASYAMAKRLGINPNPSSGGVSSGVTYVLFTGPSGVVSKKEDHAAAVTLGSQRAAQLLRDN